MEEIVPAPKIPSETSQAAHVLYNLQYIYLRIGDQLETLFTHIDVQKLDPGARMDSMSCFRLALVSAFQLAESMSDEMAAEATLRRMDWKYALYLPVHHPGISTQALCEFRQNLFSAPKALAEYGILLGELGKIGLFSHAPQPEVALTSLCQLSRLQQLRQAMKEALTLLVLEAPEWLLANVSPHWYERYQSSDQSRAGNMSRENINKEVIKLGKDIHHLLSAIKKGDSPNLLHLAETQRIEHLFSTNFEVIGNHVRWLQPACENCACRQGGLYRN
ncbi:hypothetical protein FDZ73_25045 [bacterium]|nr:MAG: hypothetical protein FDZ73_25045 [bacterium]